MDRPGERFRRARERLNLTYRQVAEASRKIAERRGSREFALGISRLADIENRSKLPTIYRLYTLCAIYKLDFDEVLRWYGVPPEQLASDSLHTALPETHLLQFSHAREVTVPLLNEGTLQMESTSFLSRVIHRWGRMPFSFLNGVDTREFRYGWIGVD